MISLFLEIGFPLLQLLGDVAHLNAELGRLFILKLVKLLRHLEKHTRIHQLLPAFAYQLQLVVADIGLIDQRQELLQAELQLFGQCEPILALHIASDSIHLHQQVEG